MVNTKLVLVAASIILAGSLCANAYFYTLQLRDWEESKNLQKQITALKNQIAKLSNQTEFLLSQKLSLQTKKVSLEKQNTDLKNQLKSMQTDNAATAVENAEIRNQIEWVKETGAPKITTRLGTADVRSSPATGHPWSGVVRFYISGEVWNMGTGPAENCRLRVTLFQGDAVANDTYVEIGTIDAGNYVYVEANIFYTGEALTNWVITSEYS